jgi:hypothetical protein
MLLGLLGLLAFTSVGVDCRWNTTTARAAGFFLGASCHGPGSNPRTPVEACLLTQYKLS